MEGNEVEKYKILTVQDIRSACEMRYGKDGEMIEVCQMTDELKQGIDELQKFSRVATIYGSARFDENNPNYVQVEKLAYALANDLGYAIITGGGGGIMEAGNRGAYRAGGSSIGATITLPREQKTNKYVTDVIPFNYFFTRKVALRYSTEVAIYCPGGFGTLDELFEVITLIQTKKMNKIPIILFGTEFWNPIDKMIKTLLVDEYKTISSDERGLYIITDDIETILEIAAAADLKQIKNGITRTIR